MLLKKPVYDIGRATLIFITQSMIKSFCYFFPTRLLHFFINNSYPLIQFHKLLLYHIFRILGRITRLNIYLPSQLDIITLLKNRFYQLLFRSSIQNSRLLLGIIISILFRYNLTLFLLKTWLSFLQINNRFYFVNSQRISWWILILGKAFCY